MRSTKLFNAIAKLCLERQGLIDICIYIKDVNCVVLYFILGGITMEKKAPLKVKVKYQEEVSPADDFESSIDKLVEETENTTPESDVVANDESLLDNLKRLASEGKLDEKGKSILESAQSLLSNIKSGSKTPVVEVAGISDDDIPVDEELDGNGFFDNTLGLINDIGQDAIDVTEDVAHNGIDIVSAVAHTGVDITANVLRFAVRTVTLGYSKRRNKSYVKEDK